MDSVQNCVSYILAIHLAVIIFLHSMLPVLYRYIQHDTELQTANEET
jgi:hypothetical protein